ncbi:MAG: cytochrome c [Proteobacteria bacterium]|nr:cytochrome c [Pseudomonadota bacterium]
MLRAPDGFYFHKMTFGGAIMPSYGHAISPQERWQIAHYIHELQRVAK